MLNFKNGQPSQDWQPPQLIYGSYESFMIILCHEYTFAADFVKCKWETPRGQQVVCHGDKFGGIVLLTLRFVLLKILDKINCLWFSHCLCFLISHIYELRYECFRNNPKLSIIVCVFPCQTVHLTKYIWKK